MLRFGTSEADPFIQHYASISMQAGRWENNSNLRNDNGVAWNQAWLLKLSPLSLLFIELVGNLNYRIVEWVKKMRRKKNVVKINHHDIFYVLYQDIAMVDWPINEKARSIM